MESPVRCRARGKRRTSVQALLLRSPSCSASLHSLRGLRALSMSGPSRLLPTGLVSRIRTRSAQTESCLVTPALTPLSPIFRQGRGPGPAGDQTRGQLPLRAWAGSDEHDRAAHRPSRSRTVPRSTTRSASAGNRSSPSPTNTTSHDSDDTADLWTYLANHWQKTGGRVPAIARHGKLSNDLMFALRNREAARSIGAALGSG